MWRLSEHVEIVDYSYIAIFDNHVSYGLAYDSSYKQSLQTLVFDDQYYSSEVPEGYCSC